MFELADRLVGIYKTHDATKSVTINPKLFADMPVPVSSQSSENNHQPTGMLGIDQSMTMTAAGGGTSGSVNKTNTFSSTMTGTGSGSAGVLDDIHTIEPQFKVGRRAVLADTTNQFNN